MNSKRFSNYIGDTNEIWAAGTLEMERRGGKRIDLIGPTLGIEVKSAYERGASSKWTVHESQHTRFPASNPGRDLYWLLVLYDLDVPPEHVRAKRPGTIERRIISRQAWAVPWDFVDQFALHRAEEDYRYVPHSAPRASDLEFAMVVLGNATLCVPKHTSLEEHARTLGFS